MHRSRLYRPIDFRGILILFIVYVLLRQVLGEILTLPLSDSLFLIALGLMIIRRIRLRDFLRDFWTFLKWFFQKLIALRLYLLIALLCGIGGIVIATQHQQEQALEVRLMAVEEKLGGSEKLRCNERDTVSRVKRAVVRIVGGESEGSGFAIQEGGYILTNFHVIEFEPTPKVVFPDNTFETADILMADKKADLAILKVQKDLPSLSWGSPKDLNPAEEVLAIGFPLGSDLSGESSVSKGSLSARRNSKDVGVEYIQTDITLNPGMSGGPMVNICGEVEGINTAGIGGLGLGISSDSIRQKWLAMTMSQDALKDVQRITFDPDASSLEAVRAFYNYLKARKLEKAFDLLSDNFKKGYTFASWKKGYATLLDTSVLSIKEDPQKENRINVKLRTSDMVDGEIIYKYFGGYWDVKDGGNRWLLWDASIKEVKNPDYDWFYSE